MSNLKYELLVARPLENLGATSRRPASAPMAPPPQRMPPGPAPGPSSAVSPHRSMDDSFDESFGEGNLSDLLSDTEEQEVKALGNNLEAQAYKVAVRKPPAVPREVENYFDRLELNERNKLRRDLVDFQIKRARISFMARGIVEEIENMDQEDEVLAVIKATARQSAFDEEEEEEEDDYY